MSDGCIKERLIDLGPVAVIYADGIAGVVICAPNIRMIFFEYRQIDGERVRCPVVEIVRPLASCEAGMVQRMIAESRAQEADQPVVH